MLDLLQLQLLVCYCLTKCNFLLVCFFVVQIMMMDRNLFLLCIAFVLGLILLLFRRISVIYRNVYTGSNIDDVPSSLYRFVERILPLSLF